MNFSSSASPRAHSLTPKRHMAGIATMAHEMFVWQSLSTEGTFLLTLGECASSLAKTPVSKGRMKAVAYGFFSYDGKAMPNLDLVKSMIPE